MNKKILSAFVSLLAVGMLALPLSMVHAQNDKFVEVTGVFYLAYDGENGGNFPGNNFIWYQTDCTMMCTGSIIAAGTVDFTFIFIKPVYEGASVVDSHRGLVREVYTLTNPIISGIPYEECELTIGESCGNWRVLGGTGDLANVHGQGTTWGITEFMIGYEGWIHFDP